jgi:hypothetical protein
MNQWVVLFVKPSSKIITVVLSRIEYYTWSVTDVIPFITEAIQC